MMHGCQTLSVRQILPIFFLLIVVRFSSSMWYRLHIEQFMGVLFLLGLRGVPSDRLAWGHRQVFALPMLHDIMSLRQYRILKRFLHFNDNMSPNAGADNCHKIRPLLVVAERFLENYAHGEASSVDEAVCPYQGRHRFVQRMGKFKRIGDGFRCVCVFSSLIPMPRV